MNTNMRRELSGREEQLMRAIAEGLKTKGIAQKLCISPKTVEAHYLRIKIKLGLVRGIGSQAALVAECKKRHPADLPELNEQTFTEAVESLDGQGLKSESA